MKIITCFVSCVVLASSVRGAQVLTLSDFLSQVKEKHLGYQASQLVSQGAMERSQEGELLTSPQLFSNVSYLDDQKPTNNPAFLGRRTVYENYTLGVAQQTSFGLSARLSYKVTRTELFGVNSAFVPLPKFYDVVPQLELTQSLWRNGLGSETRATSRVVEAQAKAISLAESLKSKLILAEAEGAYWRLAIARQLVTVAQTGVERAKKIQEWSKRRASLALADKSEALQAEAGLQGKQLELQLALDEEREAVKKFNSLRGLDSEKCEQTFEPVSPEKIAELKPIERQGKREDVLAADEMRKAAQAASQLGKEKNAPSLDLISSYGLNGRDASLSKGISDATKTAQSTLALGVKFTAPLDLGTLTSDRAGYLKEEKGAELNYQRKLFEEELEWNELNVRFNEAQRRLKMAQSIEKVQEQKLENERSRLKTGRSVLYQVVLFEQDYANSQVMTLKTELQILALMAQMKTYMNPTGPKIPGEKL
jgi:outer membrane protein TolC